VSRADLVETLLSKADGQLTSAQTEDLTALLDEFGDIFSDVPGRTTLGVHHIELQPDTKPIYCAPYCLNQEKAKVLKDELDNLLDQGVIEESTSPWASPIVMVPKADGTLRLVTDFRTVNNCTVPDPFPLPRIEDLIDRVGKAKYLTKLDMTRGYWQVRWMTPQCQFLHLGISSGVTCHSGSEMPLLPFLALQASCC